MAEAEYDILQAGDVASISFVGQPDVIATATELDKNRGWEVVAQDGHRVGVEPTRHEAAIRAIADWKMRFEGAIPCSPTSTMALARELHWARGHTRAVRAQRNWFCECPRDANLFNGTQWLKDVVTVLEGTYREAGSGNG